MVLVFYITGHGFGHATRTFAVIDEIVAIRPDARIVVRSSVPGWFLQRLSPAGTELHPIEADTGIVQIDSLALDDVATAKRAAAFYATFDARVAEEASVLRALKADAVIGDVPPLAFAAARAAGLPSIALANFTWDWIYAYYPHFESNAPGVIAQIQQAYGQATLALRMPFAGGFESMRGVARDIPLVARRSRAGREKIRQILGLQTDRPIALASFGGHRTEVPYDAIAERCAITLLLTDWESQAGGRPQMEKLRCVNGNELAALDLGYEDLVAAADIVVSKPGYGIVSECIANQTALLYTSRGAFAENDVMVETMGRWARCRFIPQDQLRAGDWEDAIRALLTQPPPPEIMAIDGAVVAARAIVGIGA